MTAVEITFMCLTVFAPLLIWFVVLLVRNKDLPANHGNKWNEEGDLSDDAFVAQKKAFDDYVYYYQDK